MKRYPRRVLVSIALSGFGGDGPDRLEAEPVGADDEERAPDPGQDRAWNLHRHQGSEHRSAHSPTAHPHRRPEQHVALADMRDAADDGGRHDGDQRGALGDSLGDAEPDGHGGHEEQPSADPDRSAEKAGAQAARDQQRVAPGHGISSSFRPTTPRINATPIFSSRSGIRRSTLAPTYAPTTLPRVRKSAACRSTCGDPLRK